MPEFNPLEASFKLIAVGGIFMILTKLTKEAFKFSWHIISTSPEKETYKAVSKVRCEECKEFFIEEDGKNICFTCRGEFSMVD